MKMYEEIMNKAEELAKEAKELYGQQMNTRLELDKNTSLEIASKLASRLDRLFYDYALDLVAIHNYWRTLTQDLNLDEINAEAMLREQMLKTVRRITRKQTSILFNEKVNEILHDFEFILRHAVEEKEKEEEPIMQEFEITVDTARVSGVFVDDVTFVGVEITGINENGDKHECNVTMDDLEDLGVKVLKKGDKIRYRRNRLTEECELLNYEPEKNPIDRLQDLINRYKEEYTEAVKNGGSDKMEEHERYADTDSFKEEIDDTEREILRQGKLPFEEEYDKEDKYYLIAKPMTVAKAHLYGADLIAPYEIRKEKLSFNEETQGSYLVYVGSYDNCLREFHSRAEYISERIDEKIHFQCVGAKEFRKGV